MAVYARTYRDYSGERTAGWRRRLVLPRYALAEVFSSRLFVAAFGLSLVWPLVCAVIVYLHHNVAALALIEVPVRELVPIDERFFARFLLGAQGRAALALTFLVGPVLVSPDLAHHGLALILARPFGRADYVLGKLGALVAILSAVTWIPALLLFAEQVALEGWGWGVEHLHVAAGIFVVSGAWIVMIALLALALSAWVRWKPVARLLFLGVFVLLESLGQLVNQLYDTTVGDLVRLTTVIAAVRDHLFGLADRWTLPAVQAWGVIAAVIAVSLLLLRAKLVAWKVEP